MLSNGRADKTKLFVDDEAEALITTFCVMLHMSAAMCVGMHEPPPPYVCARRRVNLLKKLFVFAPSRKFLPIKMFACF